MQGILLWKHPDAGSAIIWCEDSQLLAFAADMKAILSGPVPEPGDLLEVACTESVPRRCYSARLIRRAVWPDLASELMSGEWLAKVPAARLYSFGGSGNPTANLNVVPKGVQGPLSGASS